MFRFFVPAHQDAPKAVHPTMCAFHDPAPGLLARCVSDRLGFLATRPDMRCEPKLHQDVAHCLIVIGFVEAHALRLLGRGLRALDHKTLERRPHQFHVMPVRPFHCQPDRHAVPLGHQAALDAAFGAVRGIRTGFFPPRAAPWSSPRPCSARPNQSPSARQTVRPLLARGAGRHPLRPRLEIGRRPWIWHITPSDSGLPIGSPCGARKKWHRHSGDRGRAAGRRQSGGYSPVLAAAVRARPTVHRKRGSRWSSGYSGFSHVFVWSSSWYMVCSCQYIYQYTSYSDRLLATFGMMHLELCLKCCIFSYLKSTGARTISTVSAMTVKETMMPIGTIQEAQAKLSKLIYKLGIQL